MNTIDLKISFLKAALLISAKKAIRYYLNGVFVEIQQRAVRIVATDGHRAVVFHTASAEDAEDNVPAQIIIPGEVLKGIKACNRNQVLVTLTYDAAQQMNQCTLSPLAGSGRIFKPVDGKFPDYQRIMPNSAPSGEKAFFNPYYLADFAEVCATALDHRNSINYPTVYDNGNSCAPVLCGALPEFYGALMPMRANGGDWECPQWLPISPCLKVVA